MSARAPLVDRRSELAAFRAAVERVAERVPTVIRLSGEIGAGRTRLLEEFAAIARESQAGLLLTRTTRRHETPFGPLLEASASKALGPLLRAIRQPARDDADFAHVVAALAEAAARAARRARRSSRRRRVAYR
jgi:predicted ATPase